MAKDTERTISKHTVLVVDDEALVLRFCEFALERVGHRVLPASSASMAVQQYSTELVQVALLDATAPGVLGQDIRARLAVNGTKIILMSGYLEDEARRLVGGALQAHGFLQKPFTHLQLLQTIQDALREPTTLQGFANQSLGNSSGVLLQRESPGNRHPPPRTHPLTPRGQLVN